MDDIDKLVKPLIKNIMPELSVTEDLVIEVVRDIVKDEIKKRIYKKLDSDPTLRKEIKDAISLYLDAKIKEAYASAMLAKCGTKLGLDILPEAVKGKLTEELLKLFGKEINAIIEKTL
jgi:hypothetical protein